MREGVVGALIRGIARNAFFQNANFASARFESDRNDASAIKRSHRFHIEAD